jgi:hypothetical protein
MFMWNRDMGIEAEEGGYDIQSYGAILGHNKIQKQDEKLESDKYANK